MKEAIKKISRVCLFLMILVIGLGVIQKVVTTPADYRPYQLIHEFYEEPEDSLDAVYIGSSVVYSLWAAPLAWENYGIAVWPFSTPDQPLEMAEGLIREARKTQPDAVYIVALNYEDRDFENDSVTLHRMTDYMPFSLNKLKIINTYAELGNWDFSQKLEFIFPILRYHSRWSELAEEDFTYEGDGLKGASKYPSYLKKITDVTKNYRTSNLKTDVPEDLTNNFISLLEYCKNESVKLLFVTSPQMITDDRRLTMINSLKEYAEDYGFPVLDMISLVNEIGLDFSVDYYNNDHTNVHGSIKATEFLAKYLYENYGFEDKRGSRDYISWDESVEKFHHIIAPYVIPVELNVEKRDYTMAVPKISETSVYGTTITVAWEEVEKANGYVVYRKGEDEGSAWAEIARVNAETLEYKDKKLKPGITYTYTIAPIRSDENGNLLYGNYNITGKSQMALLEETKQIIAEGNCNEVTVRWKSVKNADGYEVQRKIIGKSWVKIARVEDATQYVDTNMGEGISYLYRIRAYYTDKEGNTIYGSYGKNDELWLGEITGPILNASYEDKVILSWENIEGISSYRLYRHCKDGEWEVVKKKISASENTYSDDKIEAGEIYEYKLSAIISFDGKEYEYVSDMVEVTCK